MLRNGVFRVAASASLATGLAIGLTAPVGHGQGADWPGFRGPGRDGIAAQAKPPVAWSDDDNLAWKVRLPGPGSSSPIVFGDRVYVTCYSGYGSHLDDGGTFGKLRHHLIALEKETGKVIWDKSVAGKLTKAARQVTLKEHGFASPTPITDDGKTIYCYFGAAGLIAFDRDGGQKWQADLGKPSKDAPPATNTVERGGKTLSLRWGSAASPVLTESLVIVNCSEQSNSVRAFERETGKLAWKRESADLEGCAISPMIAGKGDARVLVMALGGQTWGLAPATGELLWKVDTGTRGGMSPTPVADDELVYVFGGMGDSHAIRFRAELEDGSERVAWKSKNLGIPSPLLFNGKLFLVNSRGQVTMLNAGDGHVDYDERLEGRTGGLYASPVLAGDKLYVVSRKKGIFVYSADREFKLLSKNKFESDDSQFNASPAMSGKQMFVRSDKFLYCVRGA